MLVEAAAIGVGGVDAVIRRGTVGGFPEGFVPGSEVAGVVRSAPEGSGFTAGQRVAAFPSLGGFAEVGAADALPRRISFDKGIFVGILLQLLGPETPVVANAVIRPVVRDGGQRLAVDNLLW